MNKPLDHDALLAAYLSDGIETLPDRVVDAVRDEVHRTSQWTVIGPWRTRPVIRPSLAAAAVVMVLVSGALILNRAQPPATTDPSASPSPGASGTPAASVIPAPSQAVVTDPAGIWIATGTMTTPRTDHTAVRLLDGRVLVVGGNSVSSGNMVGLTSAELYDPGSASWSATGSLLHPLGGFRPLLLPDGRVLVGDDNEVDGESHFGAKLYDPATGSWSAAGNLSSATGPAGSATLLESGDVLVAGLNGSWLYDPETDTWTATETMLTPRYNHTATLLADGRVLVAGGDIPPDKAVDSAELYDPDTGTWSATANLSPTGNPRYDIIAVTLLQDGTVLVVRPTTTELYDPATETWTPAGERSRPGSNPATATLLANGMVLVTVREPSRSTLAELFDPTTGSWTMAAPLLRSHSQPATLLLDGTVLVAGGAECQEGSSGCPTGVTGVAELFVPFGVGLPTLPVFPSPTPSPLPTPEPTLLPAAVGPIPANAREWIVKVVNGSAEDATLFVAEADGEGLQLVGNVTPNVVPPGTTVNVTFSLPAAGTTGWSIYVNAHPDYGSLLDWNQVPLAGQILITAEGQPGWLSP